ncbi:6-hydroxy-d-nicotine oxidase [Fusarium heterosporum]|uniref:6-hydroxy-d-nicotine oxidase n=1 Tax=Fusarium heterosporum TaxID=42747 RepID=A0A8H5TUJ9_FUSHE|nr:6-hydroxy-d-nicotine oxidase [Fusarium heterosporum]
MTRLDYLIVCTLSLLPSALGSYVPSKSCKAYPGTPDWPSHSTWSRLNETLGGRLFVPTPPGAVCHKGWSNYNKDTCSNVAVAWKKYDLHTQDPVSVIYDQYTNWTCLPDADYPCSGSGYPAYVVNVTKPEHVKIGIDFARKHSIRLIVKNTGHDYMGHSVAPGSLSLWTHHLKDITYHKGAFKLHNSKTTIPGDAVTAGAGSQMYDLYTYLDKFGRVIVGGGGKSVGLGGYITGGGHSILSPKFGLAVDQVLEMTMVTPSGRILTINEDNHRDLFWAMRGGGGSTFGVLTSITLKIYKTPKVLASAWLIGTSSEASFKYDLLAYVLSQFPSLADAGLSGYTSLSPKTPNPVPAPGAPEEVAGIQGIFIAQDVQDPEYINKLFKPINDTIQKRWPGSVQFTATDTKYNSFLEWYNVYYDQGAAGETNYIVSRLLTKDSLEMGEAALGHAVREGAIPSNGIVSHLVSGKGVRNARPRGGSVSVNPGWRKTYVHALTGHSFEPLNRTSQTQAIKSLISTWQPFRELSPGTGAYINEALPFEPDWQHTFWGSNYERLLAIKKSIDPEDVLWCFPCVGSEGWEQQNNGRLCRIG